MASGTPSLTSTRPIGRYLLFGEIAAGGMATVHLGRLSGAAGFARTVAVKRLHAQYAKDPDFRSMFLDEARLAARVRHPNVVPTLDIVETDGEIFLVMEYVQGASLSRLLRAAGSARGEADSPDPWLLSTIVGGVLHGLHAAHEATSEQGRPLEIVHRDVSPQNILVGVDGIPRVLDFGVAKAVGRLQTTREGQVKGKFAYMAPEQISGRPVTRQADVYAAAVVAWESLTGERLFQADNEAAVVHAVLHKRVPLPSEVVRDLPRELDVVIMRGLERDPARRYATAREMALELERLGGVAPASEVGAWVDALVHSELAERQERVAEIESASSPELPSLSLPASPEAAAGVHPSEASHVTQIRSDVSAIAVAPLLPIVPRTPPNRFAFGAGLFVAGAIVALAGLLLLTRNHTSEVTSPPQVTASGVASVSALAPPAPLPPAPTSTITSVEVDDLPVAPPAPVAVSALPGAASAPSPTLAPPVRRRGPAPAGPASPPAAAPAANCDPPYWIDGDGHTRYKPACL